MLDGNFLLGLCDWMNKKWTWNAYRKTAGETSALNLTHKSRGGKKPGHTYSQNSLFSHFVPESEWKEGRKMCIHARFTLCFFLSFYCFLAFNSMFSPFIWIAIFFSLRVRGERMTPPNATPAAASSSSTWKITLMSVLKQIQGHIIRTEMGKKEFLRKANQPTNQTTQHFTSVPSSTSRKRKRTRKARRESIPVK